MPWLNRSSYIYITYKSRKQDEKPVNELQEYIYELALLLYFGVIYSTKNRLQANEWYRLSYLLQHNHKVYIRKLRQSHDVAFT